MSTQTADYAPRLLTAADLVAILRSIPAEEFTPSVIARTLRNVRIETASLEPYIHWQPREYTRNLIHRDDIFELLAVCWDRGTCSPIHNHSQQDCWMHVHRGALCLEDFVLNDPAMRGCVGKGIGVRRTQRMPRAAEGTVDHRGRTNEIHRVINCRSFGERAVSLHVYARPFDTCIVYEPRTKQARRKKLVYYSIDGVPV